MSEKTYNITSWVLFLIMAIGLCIHIAWSIAIIASLEPISSVILALVGLVIGPVGSVNGWLVFVNFLVY